MTEEILNKIASEVATGSGEKVEEFTKKCAEKGFSVLEIIQHGLLTGSSMIRRQFEEEDLPYSEIVDGLMRFASGVKALGISRKELKNLAVDVENRQETIYEVTAKALSDLWEVAGFTERTPEVETKDKAGIWGTYKIYSEEKDDLTFEAHYCPHRWIRINIW